MKLANDQLAEFLDACDRVGIKNPTAYLMSKRTMIYDWLKGAFPYGILPTDIDGLVHLNGHFLLLEFKRDAIVLEGKLPKGQLRCYLAFQGTVFIIGMDENEEPSCLIKIHKGKLYHMTDPIANIIENARVSHVLQWSLNPANSAREARLECTCGLVFAKTTVESDDAYTSAVRDRLWIEGGTAALAHVKTKVGRN